MLKAQLDLSVPCPDTQDFQPCMGPGCSDEGEEATQASEWLAGAQEGRVCLAMLAPPSQSGGFPRGHRALTVAVIGVHPGRTPTSNSVSRTLNTDHIL